jgi:hypothetical protein
MGSLDFLSPGGLDYPGSGAGQVQCGTPYTPPDPDGFWNQIFTPKELPYPVPPCVLTEYGTVPQMTVAFAQVPPPAAAPAFTPAPSAPSAPASAPVASAPLVPVAPAPPVPSASVPAPAGAAVLPPVAVQSTSTQADPAITPPASASPPAPVTVVVNIPAPAAPPATPAATAPTLQPTADLPAPASQPVAEAMTLTPSIGLTGGSRSPSDKIVIGYSTNPRLRARQPKAHEEFIDEILDEKFHVRMLTKDAEPVVFRVPDGFDAVELYLRAIEVNAPHGCDDDRDEIVTTGELCVSGASQGGLEAGDEIRVVVPWRHASWVELAADHLRLPIVARFYNVDA